MICIECSCDSKVINTFTNKENVVVRQRKCKGCGLIFYTMEEAVDLEDVRNDFRIRSRDAYMRKIKKQYGKGADMSDCEDFKDYPNMETWLTSRQFCDVDKAYTNGADLITVNNVLKGWNYYLNLAEEKARADERAKIIAIVERLKDSVPVNRIIDDIIKDKPKELGMLIAYDNILKELKEQK